MIRRLVNTVAALGVLVISSAEAQTVEIAWEKLFGAAGYANAVEATSDGGYIMVGQEGPWPTISLYVVKVDASGERQWQKKLGGSEKYGSDAGVANAVVQNPDGSYVVAGQRSGKPMLLKLSASGDSVWQANVSDHGGAHSVTRTPEGGFAATGYVFPSGASKSNIFLHKVKPDGSLEWSVMSGSSTEREVGNAIRTTADGGLIVAGYAGAVESGHPFIMKADAAGNKTDQATFPGIGSTADVDEFTDVRQTADGGYILVGRRSTTNTSFDTDIILMRLDADLGMDWEKGYLSTGSEAGLALRIAADGGYAIAGYKSPTVGSENRKVYLMKTSALGEKEFDLALADGLGNGVVIPKEGEYVVAGTSESKTYLAKVTARVVIPKRHFLIRDANGNPIPNKEFTLLKASMKPGNDQVVATATTDAEGKIVIDASWYKHRDKVRIARIIHTERTLKPLHGVVDNVAYRIMLDNIRFDERTSYPQTDVLFDTYDDDPKLIQQAITLDHTTILFDLVISVEWDADDAYMNDFASGIPFLANYLYDVYDGQVGLGKVVVVEEGKLWKGADILFHATTEMAPHAGLEGFRSRAVGDNQQVFMGRRWYGNVNLVRQVSVSEKWLEVIPAENYRMVAHELGHQLFGFYDEYKGADNWVIMDKRNMGYMDSHYAPESLVLLESPYASLVDGIFSSELSSAERYRTEDKVTKQFVVRGGDCWTDFEQRYEKSYDGIFAPIIKPSERTLLGGAITLIGPNELAYADPLYDAGSMAQVTIDANKTTTYKAITTVTAHEKGKLYAVPEMRVSLKRPKRSIDQGVTNVDGTIRLLGATPGDRYTGTGVYKGKLQTFLHVLPTRAAKDDDEASFAAADSAIVVETRTVAGSYTFVPTASYASASRLELGLVMNTMLTQDPLLEVEIDTTERLNRTMSFSQQRSSYSTSIDSLPGSGTVFVTAYDEAREAFPLFLNYSTMYFSSSLFGDQGNVELVLDSANAQSLGPITFFSSDLPAPTDGLDPDAERGGNVHALTVSPAATSLAGSNMLTIRYAGGDLATRPETSLQIYKWLESTRRWEKVGGTVDTLHDEVSVPISAAGTYAAFTTSDPSGIRGDDRSGESLTISASQDAGRATIDLLLARRERATVAIYNSLGQIVATLVSSELGAGAHRFFWSSTGVPNGVYYVSAETASARQLLKFSVIH